MSRRLERARRLVRTARQAEDRAAAELLMANVELHRAEDDYRRVLERSAELSGVAVEPALRSLLLISGAQAQQVRAAERDRLRTVASDHREAWETARSRTRSMEKLEDRARAERDQRRLRAERAALADVVAARAAGDAS